MDSGKAHDLYTKYCAAMAYIEVELPNGNRGIGSAFHVGEGVFVTAMHVLEGNSILEIASTDHTYIPLEGEAAEKARTYVHVDGKDIPSHYVSNGILQLEAGPFHDLLHDADVAVFKVRDIDPYTPVVELGSHLDDWLGQGDFVLSEAIGLGYPPIPMSTRPILVGARAEVNAQVDLYDTANVHFILSSMPRGGFSGGVAISEYGFALGVVTRSLTADHSSVETGLMAVLGVEAIYGCLADNHLLPDIQAEGWDGFWNSTSLWFHDPKLVTPRGQIASAVLELFDDGKRYALTIICDHDPNALETALSTAAMSLKDYQLTQTEVRPGMMRIDIAMQGGQTAADVKIAGQAMSRALIDHGYEPSVNYIQGNPLVPPDPQAGG